MLLSIGIDVGARNGAIAIIDEEFKILLICKAPFKEVEAAHTSANRNRPKLNKNTNKYEQTYKKRAWTDASKFRELFQPYIGHDIVYTIEKVSVRVGEGEISSFVFGNSLGCFEGLSAFLNPIDMYEPTPTVWKSDMGVTADKESSVKLAEKLFNCNLKDYVGKGKVDDVAEALLLAVYGFKKYYDKLENKNGG